MNNIWNILGISPTNSKKEIRKAYSAKSRQIHPLEKPEEFQQLKNAYESALKLIAGTHNTQEQNSTDYLFGFPNNSLSYESSQKKDRVQESLLKELEKMSAAAEEEDICDFAAYPFLGEIENLLSDAKRCRNKVELRQFFLTDEFLDVQYDSDFTACLRKYLMQQRYVNYQELPMPFIIELMNAYGLSAGVLSDFENALEEEKAVMFHDAQRNIAKIWSAQSFEWKTQRGYRTLNKKENIVRNMAFADYCKLLKYHRIGFLKKEREEVWGDKLLICGMWENIVEDKCKDSAYEREVNQQLIRNICFLRLVTYFLQHHKVQEEVCFYIYEHYQIDAMKGRYYEKFYMPIKEEILKQYPNMDQRLIVEKRAKEEWIEWKRQLYALGDDNYCSYFAQQNWLFFYYAYHTEEKNVLKELEEKAERLFSNPIFEEHMYEEELLEEIGGRLRHDIPPMVDRMYEEYMREDRKEMRTDLKVKRLLDKLVMKKGLWRTYEETNCYCEYEYDLSPNSHGFWVYYLMHAYGNPHVVLPIVEQGIFFYYWQCGPRENERYLSEYMRNYYAPSKEWRIRFTGMNRETGEVLAQRTECMILQDGRKLLIQYCPNHIDFYCEGRQINEAILTWKQLKEEQDTRKFLMLLAITGIEETEREEAKEIIAKHLAQIPIYEASIPFIAECLSNDTGREKSTFKNPYPYIEEKKGNIRERVDVSQMMNLEKAETFLAMLNRNQYTEEKVDKYLEYMDLPDFAKEAYKNWEALVENHMVFHVGNQNRDCLYPVCVTGLFGIGESINEHFKGAAYELQELMCIIREESIYPLGWVRLQNTVPIQIVIGKSGTFYAITTKGNAWAKESLVDLLADSEIFDDVTELIHYEKKVTYVKNKLYEGVVYHGR